MIRTLSQLSRVRIVLTTVMLVACSAVPVAAATVTLTWAPNPEPDIAGYVVHYGNASGQYVATVDVGNQTSFLFVEPDPTRRYYFAVVAYNVAGTLSGFSTEVSTNPTTASIRMSSSLPAPQPAGTSIAFTATATAATALQFKWLTSEGGAWTTRQNWSSSSTFTWTPTVANPNYTVAVWARQSGSSVDAPELSLSASMPFPITQPLALSSLSANLPSPQPVGTSVRFSATAGGGTAPYQYKWLISNGSTWTTAQSWSSSSTFGWTPSVANVNYSVGVWVRSATSTADAPDNPNAGSSMPFSITAAPGNVSVTSLTANKAAPQIPGTKVIFTATASGATSYQFKWWLYNGTAWTTAQDWSSSNKFMWTPEIENGQYQVLVRARNAANAAESDGASMAFPITGRARGSNR